MLRALQPYEVQLKPHFRTEEEYWHNVWFDIEEYVERIFVGAKSSGGDNTFNYGYPLSNHLNFYFFKFPEVEERVEYVNDDWSLDFQMSAYTVAEVVERVEEELKELEVMEDGEYGEWVKDVDE